MFSKASCCFCRVMDLVDTMLDLLPETHIMLVSILPAGDTLHPESLFQWPNDLTQGITLANSWYIFLYMCLWLHIFLFTGWRILHFRTLPSFHPFPLYFLLCYLWGILEIYIALRDPKLRDPCIEPWDKRLQFLYRVAKAFSGEERVTVVDCNHKFVPFGWVCFWLNCCY